MFPQLNTQPLGSLSTTQLLPLGTLVYSPKDQARSAFRYTQFGGTSAIAAGLLLVAPAAPANSSALALSSANSTAQLSAGNPSSSTIAIVNGATTVVANQFADGIIQISGGGIVEKHRILGNSADSVGNGTILVEMAGPIDNALVVGTNVVTLRQSPWYNPTASTTQALPVGVTTMSIPNTASVTNYGWLQVGGMALVQATTGTKGFPLVQDTSGTAGYLVNTASNLPTVAIAQESVTSNLISAQLLLT